MADVERPDLGARAGEAARGAHNAVRGPVWEVRDYGGAAPAAAEVEAHVAERAPGRAAGKGHA